MPPVKKPVEKPGEKAVPAIRGYLETLRSLQDRPVSIAVPGGLIEPIAKEGRFKTQFETGESRGFFDPKYRAEAEKRLFGYPTDLPHEERPVYGHLSDRTLEPSGSVRGYGNYNVVLDPLRTKDATFTLGDSLGRSSSAVLRPDFGLAAPTRNAIRESLRYYYPKRNSFLKEAEKHAEGVERYANIYANTSDLQLLRDLFNAPYIEAQVHKGVPWSDVRGIVYNSRMNEALANLAASGGLKTPNALWTYDNPRFPTALMNFSDVGQVPVYAHQGHGEFGPKTWRKIEPGMYDINEWKTIPEEALKEIGYRDGGVVQAFQKEGLVKPAAGWFSRLFGGVKRAPEPLPPAPEPQSSTRAMLEALRALEQRPVSIAVSEDPLRKIIEDGRFKTQFETQNSKGIFDPQVRAKREEQLFGLPPDLPPEHRPVYGHFSDRSLYGSERVGSYGRWNAVLDPARTKDATITLGDSLFERPEVVLRPGGIFSQQGRNALRKSSGQRDLLKFIRQEHGDTLPPDFTYGIEQIQKDLGAWAPYIEAQVHKGVPWSDVRGIVYNSRLHDTPGQVMGGQMLDFANAGNVPVFAGRYVAPKQPLSWFRAEPGMKSPADILSVPEEALKEIGYRDGGHVESFDEGGQKGALRPTLAQIPKKGFLRFVDDIANWFGGASRKAIDEVNAEAAKTGMEAGRFGHGSAQTGQEWVSVPGLGSPHSVNLAKTPTPTDYARMYMVDPANPENTGYLKFRRDMDARFRPEGFQVHSHPPITSTAQPYGDPGLIRFAIQGGEVGPLAPSLGDLLNWLTPWGVNKHDFSDPRFTSYITGSHPNALMALGAPDYGKGYVYSPGKSHLSPSALLKNAEDVNNQRGELWKAVQASPAVKEILTDYWNPNPTNLWAALHALRLGQHGIPITYDKKTPFGIGYLEDAMGDLFRRLSSRGEDIGGLAEGGAVEHYDEGGQKGALRPTLGQVSTLGKGALRFVTDMYDTLSPMRQEMIDKIRASTMSGKPGKGREALLFGRDETGIPSLRGIAGDELPIVGTKTHTNMPTWYESYSGINPKWRFVSGHTHPNDTISPSLGDLMIWSNYGRDPTKTAYQDMLIAAHPRGGLLQLGALDRTGLNPAQRMAARNDIIGEEMKATQRPNSLLKQHANAYTQFLKAHGLDVPVTPYKATFNDLEAGPLLDYMAGRHKVPITLDAATMLPGTDARLRDVWEEFIPFAQKMNIPVYSNYAHGGPVQHFGIGDVVEEVAKGALRRFTGARRTREAERLAAEEAALNAARDKKSPMILLPPEPRLQTVDDPRRLSYPGIYKDPRDIVDDALQPGRLIPDPGRGGPMHRLFGVDRQDLDALSQSRPLEQMRPWPLQQAYQVAPGGTGSSISEQVLNPRNMKRLLDITEESLKYPELAQTRSWYEMLPLWQRADYLGVSPEEQKLLNLRMALHSAGSDPAIEVNRGTLAHMLAQQGRLDDYIELGGTAASARGPNFPADMRDMRSHAYHKTAHVPGLLDIESSGRLWSPKHKVPTYAAATDPVFPNYTRPVADSHLARGVGYPDVRTAKSQDALFKELTNPEYDDFLPWWDRLTEKSGMRPIGNQALLWNVMGPQTGVSFIGPPKLEMLSNEIMKAARRLNVSPETARDLVITGKAGAFAEGGPVGYYEAGGQVGNVGNVGDPGTLGSDRVPFFDFQTPGENEGPLSALASNNVQGYAGGGTVNGYARGGLEDTQLEDISPEAWWGSRVMSEASDTLRDIENERDVWPTMDSARYPWLQRGNYPALPGYAGEGADQLTYRPEERAAVRDVRRAMNNERIARINEEAAADPAAYWKNMGKGAVMGALRSAAGISSLAGLRGSMLKAILDDSYGRPTVEGISEYLDEAIPVDRSTLAGEGGADFGEFLFNAGLPSRAGVSRLGRALEQAGYMQVGRDVVGQQAGRPGEYVYPPAFLQRGYAEGGQVPGYRFGGEMDQWQGVPGMSMYADGGPVEMKDGGFLHDVLGTLGGMFGNLIPIPVLGPMIGKFAGHSLGNLLEGGTSEIGDDAARDFSMGYIDPDRMGFERGGSVDDDALLYHAIDTQEFSRGGALRYCGGGYAR